MLHRKRHSFAYYCQLQGDIFLNPGAVLDQESSSVPHDQNGNAAFTFGVAASDGGNPSQLSYASVSLHGKVMETLSN